MLAVAMEERHPLFPDVPTFKELGFDMVGGAYRGMAVPKATPAKLRKQWPTCSAKSMPTEVSASRWWMAALPCRCRLIRR